MKLSFLIALASLLGLGSALPTSELVPRDCNAEIRAFNLERRSKRSLVQRSMITQIPNLSNACIASPEVPRVNYVANPPLRTDVTDGQQGISLTLDVGVMDVSTCKPLPNAMIEVWSPNAQGNYGSFLRGAQATTSSGIVEFQTIFPGFPSGAANHINLMVHQNIMSSPVSHVGQVFFTDRWTEVVSMQPGYNKNTNVRMLNAQDPMYVMAGAQGYSPIVDIESIHDDWPEGVIGYITLGVNPTKISTM